MAYNKNYNGGRNNNGYRNGNYNKRQYRDDSRDFERVYRTTDDNMYELNIRRFKKKDIKIVDMNGKVYIIDGNFSHEFALQTAAYKERFEEAEAQVKKNNADVNAAMHLMNLYKECCLMLINHNVNGTEYTMQDVNSGFNDINALVYLMKGVFDIVEKEAKKLNKVE